MERLCKISEPDHMAMELSECKWNSVAKPLKSLGLLEKAVTKIAGITGNAEVKIDKRCTVVMCADNGVVAEGVTQSDSSVTALVAESIANDRANINLVSKSYNIDVIAVDMGMITDVDDERIIIKKTAYGTKNIYYGNAMTLNQAEQAITAGMDIVRELKAKGYDILITGEMGIGNTTTSSALASVILDQPVRNVTGCGAGLDKERLKHKINVIEHAIAVNDPDKTKPIELISKICGFDIAGMTGLFVGGAVYRIPVVIDGFISAVAAKLACMIVPETVNFMLCSHVSKEPAGRKMLESMGLKAIIEGELCLGEGTGGAMLIPLLDGALSVYHSAHRFDELQMDQYEDYTKC